MEKKPMWPDQIYKMKIKDITMDTTPAAEVIKGKDDSEMDRGR